MNENINLIKILENCPEGFPLYSTIYGNVTFLKIINNVIQFIYFYKTSYGTFRNIAYVNSKGNPNSTYSGECTLFPSKEQRDWNKFTAPWLKKEKFDPKTLKPFDKVLVKCTSIYNSNLVWRVGLFSYFHVEDNSIRVYTLGSDDNSPNSYVIPYNDNTKHLVNTTDEAPEYYRYWED